MTLDILLNILRPGSILVAFVGCVFGIVMGCIPGLNGGIGISLLLPFTFSMDPARALLLLGGVFMGSSYGGSISAILLNVPGTAEAYCTGLEGYPMACGKRGKEALLLAVLSSVFGGLVGVIALIFFAPTLARVALRFGPAEYFLLGIVGLTVVGSLTGKNALKGVIAVCVGLTLGMIGFDTVSGDSRLTYGSSSMLMGIQLIPVILGLYAMTEMLTQLGKVFSNKSTKVGSSDEKIQDLGQATVRSTLSTMLKNKFLLLKSSLIGTFIGILPGPGAAISSFLAYGEAKRTSKGERYANGNPRGIIASESANNAAVGGALVPMLSLGIPGSPSAAIMYGAMVIHGLQAGPELFNNNPVFAYTFSYGMLLTIVVMGIVGVMLVPLFSKLLKVDMRYIIVGVIICSLLGAYSIRNSMFDVMVAVAFGLIGYLFNKWQVPTAPIILGIILSSLIEKNFRLMMTITRAAGQTIISHIFSRPICIAIMCLGVFLIGLNFRTMILEKKYRSEINQASND